MFGQKQGKGAKSTLMGKLTPGKLGEKSDLGRQLKQIEKLKEVREKLQKELQRGIAQTSILSKKAMFAPTDASKVKVPGTKIEVSLSKVYLQ